MPDRILVAKSSKATRNKRQSLELPLSTAQPPRPGRRRHGDRQVGHLLRVLAEGFSAAGVPVFMADVKGDLATIAGARRRRCAGGRARQDLAGARPAARRPPHPFLRSHGRQGHLVRATAAISGRCCSPDCSSSTRSRRRPAARLRPGRRRQAAPADRPQGPAALLQHMGDNAAELSQQYGNLAPATPAAIQRAALAPRTRAATSSSASRCWRSPT